MPRAVSRKDFLKLGGVGLAGAALVGAAGCGGSLGGNKEVVRFLTGTEETTTQERAVTEIQVDGFEEQHPRYALEREATQSDELRKVIQTRLRSDEPPDVFSFDTGPGFGGVLADAGLLYPLEKAYQQRGWGIYEWAKQRATYNGTLYGVPDQVEELIVYYNKDLVPGVPKTVGELRGVAEELKLRGIPAAQEAERVPRRGLRRSGDARQYPARGRGGRAVHEGRKAA
jgi:raffinose/stachyose/melibiose transport system substrate-binding protein